METTRRLNINNTYRIQLACSEDEIIAPMGLVVRESLKGTIKKKTSALPFYEVALKFTELKDKEKGFIDNLISNLE